MNRRQSAIPALLDAEGLAGLLGRRPDIRLLDVRTPGEFEGVHIRSAYNVPLDHLGEHAPEIRAVEEPVVLICQGGGRARQAEAALQRVGMANLHVLDGGMNSWLAAGKSVERGAPRMSLERQVRILAGGLAAAGGVLALTVNPLFGLLPAAIGSGLVCAGVMDSCAMGMLLARLPHNRPARCDVDEMVRALATGSTAPGSTRADAPADASLCDA